MASYTPSMNLKLEETYGCHPSIRNWGKLVRCLDKLWAMRDQHGLTQITYRVCICSELCGTMLYKLVSVRWHKQGEAVFMWWHCTALHHCPFSSVLPFYLLLFSSSSPFLLSPCHHFLSRQSALTVGPYLCLCSVPCAVDVWDELLNVVTIKNTASGDVLPCDLIEIYQHFKGMCCHQL